MAREFDTASYECDCGYQSLHCEGTINDLKRLSLRKRQILGSDDGKHEIIFEGGEVVAMWCPKVKKTLKIHLDQWEG